MSKEDIQLAEEVFAIIRALEIAVVEFNAKREQIESLKMKLAQVQSKVAEKSAEYNHLSEPDNG